MSDVDFLKELQAQCLKDSEEHFDVVNQTMTLLLTDPLNSVRALLKIFHNLKGNFQAVGFSQLVNFIHSAEDGLAATEATLLKFPSVSGNDLKDLQHLLAVMVNSLELKIQLLKDFVQTQGLLIEKKENQDDKIHHAEIQALRAWKPKVSGPPVIAKFKVVPSVAVVTTKVAAAPIQSETKLKDELYLLCKNGAKYFAVSIANVVEIVCTQALTPMPTPNKLLRGLLNLRGEVMPILDLCSTFDGRKFENNTVKAYVVIVRVGAHGFGFEIEEVHEVMPLKSGSFQSLTEVDRASGISLVTHISLTDNKTILVLDLNKAMAAA